MNQAIEIDTEAIVAILTGDLVASTQAPPEAVDRAMAILARGAGDIADWTLGSDTRAGDTLFTRFRGDGWQVLVRTGAFGLRAALYLSARLAAEPGLPATRIAIGLSTIDRVPGPDLSSAHGAAFAVSGRALSDMGRSERLCMAGRGVSRLTEAFVGLLDDRAGGWTAEQAEAISHAIGPQAPTQAEIAATLGISPQALSARLRGAGWPALRRVLEEWERPRPPEGDTR